MSARVHLASIVLCAAAGAAAAAQRPGPLTRIYDTRERSKAPWSADALAARTGWTLIPEGNTTHRFGGDTAVLNDRLAVVIRGAAGGMEIYSLAAGAACARAEIACAAGRSSTAGGIGPVRIAENAAGAAAVTVAWGAPDPATVTLRLPMGQGILEVSPGRRASVLNVATRARHVVVPDFFGDDMVFGPETSGQVGLPAENFFLQLLDGRDAIMMCVWQPRRLGASAAIAAPASGRRARCSAAIDLVSGKSVWLALLEGKGIWHQAPSLAGLKGEKSVWKPPFAGKWRCSRPGPGGFAVSWDFSAGPGSRARPGGAGGPVVVYPIDRAPATPLTVYCPTDVLRNTLGVGPCEHILATEGLATPTNPTPDNVMTWIQRQLKRRRGRPTPAEVRKRLAEMTRHAGRTRTRIVGYRDLAGAVLKLCRGTAPPPPSAAGLQTTAERISGAADEGILACGHVEAVEQLAAAVLALVDKPDAATTCEPLAAQLRAIGAAQSRTLSKCRLAVCWLRQQCAAAARKDRSAAELAAKIQARVERVLK